MSLRITVQIDTTVPSGGRIRIVNQSVTGPPGTNGVGVPAGGTTGQALVKSSNVDYATNWTTISSGAPTTAQYVTLATNGTLTNERVLTAGTGVTLTDAGAGSTVTVATSAILPTIIDAKGDLIVGTAADTAARLAVGTNGLVLTADSAQAGGVKWAGSVPTWNPIINTGNQWLPNVPLIISGGSTNRTVLFVGFVIAIPFVVTEPLTISQIATGWTVAPTSGHTFRMAVYSTTNWYDCTLLVQSSVVSNGTTGRKTVAVSWSLPVGRYYAAYLVPNGETGPQGRWPHPVMWNTNSGETNLGMIAYRSNAATLSTMPSTMTLFPQTANPIYWPWGFDLQ